MSHTMYILADVFWNIFICNIISIHIPTPVIQKILKMKKGRDGEKVNKQDGMPM